MHCIAIRAAESRDIFTIYKSSDRGRSWSRSDEGMPTNSRISAFATLDDSIFAGTDTGIFISRDNGQSWGPIADAAITSVRIISLTTVRGHIYAGTDGSGLFKSSDKGMTWTPNANGPAKKVRCLLGVGDTLYAGGDREGVFASKDAGQNWTRLHKGLPDSAQVFALSDVKGKLFAGLYSNGLYAWNEEQQRWMKVGDISPLVLASIGGTLIAGHNPGGIYWSSNLGKTWSKATYNTSEASATVLLDEGKTPFSDAPVWELAAKDNLVFAGAAAGIYYSDDRGRTWVKAQAGLPAESPGISFLIKGNVVLAGSMIAP
jgi:hypothetical protein